MTKLEIESYKVAELEAALVHDKFTQGRFRQALHALHIGYQEFDTVDAATGLAVAILASLSQWSPLEWSSQLLVVQTLRDDLYAAVEVTHGESYDSPQFHLAFADFEWFSWTSRQAMFYHVVTFDRCKKLPRVPVSSWLIDLRALSRHLNRQIQRLRGKDAPGECDPTAAGR